ncbi:hypothetical protein M9H77_21271 [Catharanthus roseus]|uniref:Uncharacterized protein n=1 Tax=Catharanthus roseus TaxID=4058 RepID=A0ACC0ALV7_CATRO|nr:hypothetical protein M9H77_21271 [Catharanthus roseus]
MSALMRNERVKKKSKEILKIQARMDEESLPKNSLMHSGAKFDPSCYGFGMVDDASLVDPKVVDFDLEYALVDILHNKCVRKFVENDDYLFSFLDTIMEKHDDLNLDETLAINEKKHGRRLLSLDLKEFDLEIECTLKTLRAQRKSINTCENPKANYQEQAKAVITLRNRKLVDNKVGEPIKDSELNENETKRIDMGTKIEKKIEKELASSSNSKTLESSPVTSYKAKGCVVLFFVSSLLLVFFYRIAENVWSRCGGEDAFVLNMLF